MGKCFSVSLSLLVTLLLPSLAFAGGAWVPAPGDGDVQIGYSQKTANRTWSSRGDTNIATAHHDFRYTYLSGEVGLIERLSFTFLTTYLDGREGPIGDFEKNSGPSDAWFGAKFRLQEGKWPMALALTMRTPEFYDIDGPYTRHLFNEQGEFITESPEWRGVLKYDFTLAFLLSRSIKDGRGWMNLMSGYTYRQGAPADEVPFIGEVGWPLPWRESNVKFNVTYFQSLGNDSPREPDDRFGSRPGFNFNNASIVRAGVSFILPLDGKKRWNAELGYNQWLWGKSARQYDEPYVSVGRRF